MDDVQKRWTYEQIAKQIEREDNLYQARIRSCIVVNLALLAAAATQINLPDLGLKNLVIIGCSVVGIVITYGIWSSIANGEKQLAYLRGLFENLASDLDVELPRPFLGGAVADSETAAPDSEKDAPDPEPKGRGLKKVSYPWTPIILAFLLMWAAIAIVALLASPIPHILRETLIWQRLTSMFS